MALIRNVCSAASNKPGMCLSTREAADQPPLSRAEMEDLCCDYCSGSVFTDLPSEVTAPVTDPKPIPPPRTRLLQGSSAERKEFPMCTGLLDYFPDALAEVSQVSYLGNEKHNPGEPLHHARGKSMDHADCCARHLTERGGFDVIVINGVERRVRHTAALAWRALALCQAEIEAEMGFPLPRGATAED